MILLDTHIWIWWIHKSPLLTKRQLDEIRKNENDIIGVSVISCWEIAKLVEYKRLGLISPISEWFEIALNYPGVRLYPLTPEIAIESTRLPGEFHNDPADQIIVATARLNGCSLITSDRKILKYPHATAIR